MSRPRERSVRVPRGDFDTVRLAPGEVLVLKPNAQLSPEAIEGIAANIPASLKGRIVIVNPGAFDTFVLAPAARAEAPA